MGMGGFCFSWFYYLPRHLPTSTIDILTCAVLTKTYLSLGTVEYLILPTILCTCVVCVPRDRQLVG